MEIYFSPYQLTPLRKANHLGDLLPKAGIYLKTNNQFEMADYFPHVSLGDQPVEAFLASFPDLTSPYHLSILAQLRTRTSPIPATPFLNHQLWYYGARPEAPVVKYKIMNKDDHLPEDILRSSCRIRLDANGIFEGLEIFKFLSKLDIQQIARIDYIEDPSYHTSWSNIPIPTAQDFITGHKFKTLIYKPNRSYMTEIPEKTIFSGYMGSPLGMLHVYRELIKRGDLSLYHGLITPDVYADEVNLFQGNYTQMFTPDHKAIKQYTESVHDQQWSHLCSL